MIPIALFKKFLSKQFIASVEVIQRKNYIFYQEACIGVLETQNNCHLLPGISDSCHFTSSDMR